MMTGFMCSTSVYEYGGELRKRAGEKFWNMFSKWDKLTDTEKAACRIGGGCERF